jgi:hypothetical protein
LHELFQRFLAHVNKEAQPNLCKRHLARAANREAQLDSFWLRHLACAPNREAQLDSCDVGWELSEVAISCSDKDSGSDFLSWHSPRV